MDAGEEAPLSWLFKDEMVRYRWWLGMTENHPEIADNLKRVRPDLYPVRDPRS